MLSVLWERDPYLMRQFADANFLVVFAAELVFQWQLFVAVVHEVQ